LAELAVMGVPVRVARDKEASKFSDKSARKSGEKILEIDASVEK
jgi:hypothetical protein